MHEISIGQSIVNSLEAELEEEQFPKVREIHVKIGVLSGIDANILKQVYKYLVADSPFKNSVLHTDMLDVVAGCEHCALNFRVENYRFVCPGCGNPSSKIIEGNELTIHKIILDEPSYAEINQ